MSIICPVANSGDAHGMPLSLRAVRTPVRSISAPSTLLQRHFSLSVRRLNDDTLFSKFTHLSSTGEAKMLSIASKPSTKRIAVAIGTVHFSPSKQSTSALLSAASVKKGDILAVARIAGIQAAKQTSSIIPLCHNIPLASVEVGMGIGEGKVDVECRVECVGSTGVEMEALCGVMGASLCVYDMCKSVDKGMRIDDVKVIEKRGGKSGDWIDGERLSESLEYSIIQT